MTGIPLSSVVAFLRPRGALGVLEGAPWFTRYPTGNGSLCPFSLTSAYTSPSAMEMEAGSPNKAMLYLGSGDVCPAAEGWAARVLVMARGVGQFLEFAHGEIVLGTVGREEIDHAWRWDATEPDMREGYERTYFPAPSPSTPAERLAAVLRYEMERAR